MSLNNLLLFCYHNHFHLAKVNKTKVKIKKWLPKKLWNNNQLIILSLICFYRNMQHYFLKLLKILKNFVKHCRFIAIFTPLFTFIQKSCYFFINNFFLKLGWFMKIVFSFNKLVFLFIKGLLKLFFKVIFLTISKIKLSQGIFLSTFKFLKKIFTSYPMHVCIIIMTKW